MKQIFTLAISLVFAATALAQQKDVTKFLGIPVDGTKAEMIRKLEAKGFTVLNKETLTGEFNGENVLVGIMTNNNKVWRIVITDKNTRDDRQIKIRFNTLFDQFKNNKHYSIASMECNTIPVNENIPQEILVNKKIYEAVFYQYPFDLDKYFEDESNYIKTKYTSEQLADQTEELQKQISDDRFHFFFNTISNKLVWFKISESNGEYYIAMYYENLYNRANGEDL